MAALRSLLFILVLGGVSILLLSNLTPRLALTLLGQGTLVLPLGVWLLGAIALGVGLGLWFSLLFRWVAGPLPRLGIPGRRFSGDRLGQGSGQRSGQRWGRRGNAEEDGEDLEFDFVDAEADAYAATYGREDRSRSPGQPRAGRPGPAQVPLNPNPTWHEPESWDDWEDDRHPASTPESQPYGQPLDLGDSYRPRYADGSLYDEEDEELDAPIDNERYAKESYDDSNDREDFERFSSSKRDRPRDLRIDPTAVYEANYRVLEPSGPPLPDLSIPSREADPRPNDRSNSRSDLPSERRKGGKPSSSDWDDDWDDQW